MTQRTIIFLFLAFAFFASAVLAYSSAARDSLLKSRDQVADQRAQLEKAYDGIDRKIEDLQKQKFSVGQYLKDCDRTLRELDNALSAQDSAYKNIH